MQNAKVLMGGIIAKLNKAGFSGGFYRYNKGECSCCYGLKNVFFQVNENIPENWGNYGSNGFYFKIQYNTDDKVRATEFRKITNKLVHKQFGKLAQTAKSNYEAIIVDLTN